MEAGDEILRRRLGGEIMPLTHPIFLSALARRIPSNSHRRPFRAHPSVALPVLLGWTLYSLASRRHLLLAA